MTGLTIENGKIVLTGYPEGSKALGLAMAPGHRPNSGEMPRLAALLCRLREFEGDMRRVEKWSMMSFSDDVDFELREACAIAAILKFCGCFDSTAGLRQRPLKPKKIFCSDDRSIVSRLRILRNRIVAHDEQLTTGHYPLLIVGPDASAIEAVNLVLDVPTTGMGEHAHLPRLAGIAVRWIAAEGDKIAGEITDLFGRKPIKERKRLVAESQEFKIHIREEDVLAGGQIGREV